MLGELMMELRAELIKEQNNQTDEDILSPLSFLRSLPGTLHTAPVQFQKEHEEKNCSQIAIHKKNTQPDVNDNTEESIYKPCFQIIRYIIITFDSFKFRV